MPEQKEEKVIGVIIGFYGAFSIHEINETPTERFPFGFVRVTHKFHRSSFASSTHKYMIKINRKGKHFTSHGSHYFNDIIRGVGNNG